jgi:hypothetical protein
MAMPSRLGFLLRLAALAATALLLLAHSPTGDAEPSCDGYPAFRQAYRVEGSCGAVGVIELAASEDSCDIWQEGDDVGLPPVGTRHGVPKGNLASGGFRLYDPQQPRGFSCTASESPEGLSIFCRDADDRTCNAELNPEG